MVVDVRDANTTNDLAMMVDRYLDDLCELEDAQGETYEATAARFYEFGMEGEAQFMLAAAQRLQELGG